MDGAVARCPSGIITSEILHVFDQCPLIFVAHVVAVVMALVLDEVRAGAHVQEPLQHGRPTFGVVDDAQLAEVRFRPAVQDTIDVSQQNGFDVLRVYVRYKVDWGPFRHAQKFRVEVERSELGILEDLGGDWRRLDERIAQVTEEIEVLARESESCRQLMTVPGIGPLIASAMVAAIANGAAFTKGRDFAAWLGLVPKQMSTGDRTILGRISKRGNRYLRTLFMQGARVILLRPANWAKHSFGPWLTTAAKRLHHNVLATALANKLARIAWTVLAQRRNYETRVMAEAA
jgi:Transposase IS116/IS110/IS902 family